MDWVKAEKHLSTYEAAYKELVDMPDCNPYFALGWIAGLRKRFNSGERTQDLYDEIMAIE